MMNTILEYLMEPTKIKWIIFWFIIMMEVFLLIFLKIRRSINTNKKTIENTNKIQSKSKDKNVVTKRVDKVSVIVSSDQAIENKTMLKTKIGQSNEDWRIETEQNRASAKMGVL